MIPRAIQDKISVLANTYVIDGNESKGANGWLFYATNKITNLRVAIKFYYWGVEPELHVEPRMLAQFNSPNIVPLLVAELIEDGWACFISPRFVSDIEGLIARGGITVHQSLDIAINVLSGVGALHAGDIVHRDLKPANILLGNDGVAAVGDFGSVATINGRGEAPASRHSILYRPPESFATNLYTPVGDLYQVGLVVYELVGGELSKDPSRWMTVRQRAEHDAIASECDQSLYQDDVLRGVITSGRLVNSNSIPFWVPSGVKKLIRRQTATSAERRLSTAGQMMASLVRLRRGAVNWVGADFGALATFEGGSARVVVNGADVCVEIDRGKGWRRDKSMERTNSGESCDAINRRFA